MAAEIRSLADHLHDQAALRVRDRRSAAGTAALSHAAFRVRTVFYTALRRCAPGLATLVSLDWSNYRRLPHDIGRIQGDRLTATG